AAIFQRHVVFEIGLAAGPIGFGDFVRRIDGYGLYEKVASQPQAMKVGGRLRPIEAVAEFVQERVDIELPETRIESVRLELLDEVAVDILEIMHHLADQGARRRISPAADQSGKYFVLPLLGDDRREEVGRLADLIALMEFLGRRLCELRQLFVQ